MKRKNQKIVSSTRAIVLLKTETKSMSTKKKMQMNIRQIRHLNRGKSYQDIDYHHTYIHNFNLTCTTA